MTTTTATLHTFRCALCGVQVPIVLHPIAPVHTVEQCERNQAATWYTVETIASGPRYAGPDFTAAVSALLSIDVDAGEEGWAVATTNGAYDFAASQRVENTAIQI